MAEPRRHLHPAVTEIGSAWDHYIARARPETTIRSAVARNRHAIDEIVLQNLAMQDASRTREEMIVEIQEIVEATYLRRWTDKLDPDEKHLPDAGAIAAELVEQGLLIDLDHAGSWSTPLRNDDIDALSGEFIFEHLRELGAITADDLNAQRFVVSRLGLSITRNALPVASISTLRKIADSYRNEQGLLDLLFWAVWDPNVQAALGGWVAWNRGEPESVHRDLGRQLQRYLSAYAHPDEETREQAFRELSVPDADPVTGRQLIVQPRSELTTGPQLDESSPVVKLLAVGPKALRYHVVGWSMLRLAIVYEWFMSEPLEAISLRMRERVRTQSRKKRPFRWEEPDITQLAESVGKVLSAAAELLDEPEDRDRLRELATRVAYGLPAHLADLLDLRVDGLHREALVPLAFELEPDDLTQLLDDPRLGMPDPVREDAKRELEAWNEDQERRRAQLPLWLRDLEMPGGEYRYGEALAALLDGAVNVDEALDAAEYVLRVHGGLPPKRVPTELWGSLVLESAGSRVSVHVVTVPVTRELAAQLRPHVGPIVALAGTASTARVPRRRGWIKQPSEFLFDLNSIRRTVRADDDPGHALVEGLLTLSDR